MRASLVFAAALCGLAAGLTAVLAQDNAAPQFDRTEAMIPVRDGIKLHAVIFQPKRAGGPLPILLERTPYGAGRDEAALRRRYQHLIADGYIFVFEDIRGRFGSEGQFVMQRPPRDRRDAHSIDEATDAYDTIEWLLHNISGNNGRAGMLGISYGGWLTAMALLERLPSRRRPPTCFWATTSIIMARSA